MGYAAHGKRLDDVVAQGTPTSKYWIRVWMAHWEEEHRVTTRAQEPEPMGGSGASPRLTLNNLHHKLYEAGKFKLVQWQVEKDTTLGLGASKATRWSNLLNLIRDANRVGNILFQLTTETCRQGTRQEQTVVRVAHLDYPRYVNLFEDSGTFGDITTYGYQEAVVGNAQPGPMGLDEGFDEMVGQGWSSGPRGPISVLEVSNLSALEARLARPAAETGERRQATLAAMVKRIRATGYPVDITDGQLEPCSSSSYWAMSSTYGQHDGYGLLFHAGTGIQNITRESREAQLSGLCGGEFDLVAAVYQAFLLEFRRVATDDEYESIGTIVAKYITNSTLWVNSCVAYYEASHYSTASNEKHNILPAHHLFPHN